MLGGQERGGRLFDQLLVPPLQRAVPGGHHDHPAVLVGQALCLHVPRALQVALDEALRRGRTRPPPRAPRTRTPRRIWSGVVHHLQPAPAAAERGLDRDRQAVLGGERRHLRRATDRPVGARRQRRAHRGGDVPRGHLVAERVDRGGRRADPGQPGVDHGTGEAGVLGQEAVAGVDRVGARVGGPLEDLLDGQVAVGRALPLQRVGLVGHRDVQRVEVGLRVDGDAGQARVRQARTMRTAISPRLAMSTLRTSASPRLRGV